jgi:hypothetical protein
VEFRRIAEKIDPATGRPGMEDPKTRETLGLYTVCSDPSGAIPKLFPDGAFQVYSIGSAVWAGHPCTAYLVEKLSKGRNGDSSRRVYLIRGGENCPNLYDDNGGLSAQTTGSGIFPGDYLKSKYNYTGALPADWQWDNQTYPFLGSSSANASPLLPEVPAAPSTSAGPTDTTAKKPSTCFDFSKREPHSLEGKLLSSIVADLPNYEDVRKGDVPVSIYVLQLKFPICMQGETDDGAADSSVSISQVQLVPKDWNVKTEASLRALLGFNVKIDLSSVQMATTAHDHVPLIGWVTGAAPVETEAVGAVISRLMPPRADLADQTEESATPATVVRAFYAALSLGNGEVASQFVIPEKRTTGPYSPESISRFYGPMPEPLNLLELKSQAPGEYMVRYHFRTNTRVCQGRAVVTTTQREGLNFIETIHPLDGC